MDQLPDDVLLAIFAKLSLRERVRCEAVCKRWKMLLPLVPFDHGVQIILEYPTVLCKYEKFPQLDYTQTDEHLHIPCFAARSLLQKYSKGSFLRIWASDEDGLFRCVQTACRHWKRLEKLEIGYASFFPMNVFLGKLAKAGLTPKVTGLVTETAQQLLSIPDSMWKFFSSLKHIRVICPYDIPLSGLPKKLPPELKTFRLNSGMSFNESDFDYFSQTFGAHLQVLSLKFKDTFQIEALCANFQRLTSLRIHVNYMLSETYLKSVKTLSTLKHLSIREFGFSLAFDCNDVGFHHWSLRDTETLVNKSLEKRVIRQPYFEHQDSRPDFLDEAQLPDLSFLFAKDGLRLLKHLELHCRFHPNSTFPAIVENCQNLQTLSFHSNWRFDSYLLNLRNLTKLHTLQTCLAQRVLLPLTALIRESSNLTNFSFTIPSYDCWPISMVFREINRKARRNPNQTYKLSISCVDLLSHLCLPLPKNIKLYPSVYHYYLEQIEQVE